jgi:hypothetical protein
VAGKIVWLRTHCHFGPAKIAMYPQRYQDAAISSPYSMEVEPVVFKG